MERLLEFTVNHPFLIALFVAILALLLWNLFSDRLSGVKPLTPAELTRLLNHEDAVLLDIRSKAEFDKGHILNARNIPAAQIDQKLEQLKSESDQPFILCCNSGMDSQRVARRLLMQGFPRVHTLKGGMHAWRNDALPLTKE